MNPRQRHENQLPVSLRRLTTPELLSFWQELQRRMPKSTPIDDTHPALENLHQNSYYSLIGNHSYYSTVGGHHLLDEKDARHHFRWLVKQTSSPILASQIVTFYDWDAKTWKQLFSLINPPNTAIMYSKLPSAAADLKSPITDLEFSMLADEEKASYTYENQGYAQTVPTENLSKSEPEAAANVKAPAPANSPAPVKETGPKKNTEDKEVQS
jgi:hypothetical protein